MVAFPDDLEHNLPAECKRKGTDWHVVFNPKVKGVLDIQLVHNLMHERCVFLVSWEMGMFNAVAASCVALSSRRMEST